MSSLIFFDINGTLIKRDSRTDLPFQFAVNQFLKVENGMDGINTSARSDKDVFIEILTVHQIRFTEQYWNSFLKLYEIQLEKYKSSDVWRENADAVSFVNTLSNTNHKLSLITGELSIGAKYKLEKLGIWKYFPVGGFGEDHLTRFGIAEAALEKAIHYYGKNYSDIIVIGDTILDIQTARHLNARVYSITTGSNTREELLAFQPDKIFDEFQEIVSLFF